MHEKRRTDVISTLRETEISLRLTRIKANVNVPMANKSVNRGWSWANP